MDRFQNYNPPTAVDVVALRWNDTTLEALVGQRNSPPHQWALPGGFQEMGDTLERTAVKELEEETGYVVAESDLQLLTVLSRPDRDPRMHVNSVSYMVMITNQPQGDGRDDLANVGWVPIVDLTEDGYLVKFYADHELILSKALQRIGQEKGAELLARLMS